MNQRLSIVLPVYNQADHIGAIVEEYVHAFENVQNPCEFLLVVNGCRDASLDVCSELATRFPSVHVLHSERGGWGLAVRLGLEAASGDILCYTNSARTSARDLVLLMLYAVANPGAAIKAHRRSRETFMRRAGSFLYNFECRVLFDLPTWDINATPKTFYRDLFEKMTLTRDDDLIDVEFYAEAKRLEAPILEVPIYSKARHGGASTTNLRSAYRMYAGAWRLARARRVREAG